MLSFLRAVIGWLTPLVVSLRRCRVTLLLGLRSTSLFGLFAIVSLLMPRWGWAADTLTDEVSKQPLNMTAITLFVIFVTLTLAITYWAAKQTKTVKDFYTAGGGISGSKNGFAIAGDYMSAAAFLGLTAMTFTGGYDGLIYAVCFLAGWPMMLFLIAERLRNLGQYTFADVISCRFAPRPSRIFAASSTLMIVTLYLIVQIVGAGKLVELLFGIDYVWAVISVGILMMLYVLFGGMLATTWVQIIKAVLLLSGGTFMMVMVLYLNGFSLETLITNAMAVHTEGGTLMQPGKSVSSSVETFSMAIGLMFGIAGLPHILMRFFTVPDAKEARKSVVVASTLIGYFNVLTFVIGLGAIIILNKNPSFFETVVKHGVAKTDLIGGSNMTAIHLASALGGNLFLGFISAVAFATILAVVAGLTLSGASAVSHDLYASVLKNGNALHDNEIRVSRITVILLSLLAIGLGLVFEKQNLAFMVSLAFAVAASANFPILLLAMFWQGLTTRGVVMGGFAGLSAAVLLIVLGPSVWVDVLHNTAPVFPFKNVALFSMPVAFIVAWMASVTDHSAQAALDKQTYASQYLRALTGIGTAKTHHH